MCAAGLRLGPSPLHWPDAAPSKPVAGPGLRSHIRVLDPRARSGEKCTSAAGQEHPVGEGRHASVEPVETFNGKKARLDERALNARESGIEDRAVGISRKHECTIMTRRDLIQEKLKIVIYQEGEAACPPSIRSAVDRHWRYLARYCRPRRTVSPDVWRRIQQLRREPHARRPGTANCVAHATSRTLSAPSLRQ